MKPRQARWNRTARWQVSSTPYFPQCGTLSLMKFVVDNIPKEECESNIVFCCILMALDCYCMHEDSHCNIWDRGPLSHKPLAKIAA